MDTHRAHALNLRLLRLRASPERDDPAVLVLELLAAGRTDDAMELVDRALSRDPRDVDVLLSCGLAAIRAGKLSFAQWSLMRAAKLAPTWTEPLRLLVQVLDRREQPEQALALARRAVALGERDPEIVARVERADRHAALSARLKRYRGELDRGASPSEDPTLLAQALIACERPEEALEVVRSARAFEDDADLWVQEARALFAIGEERGGEAALACAIEAAPDWPEPACMLAERKLACGAALEALALIERALIVSVEDARLLALRIAIEERLAAIGIAPPERALALDEGVDRLLATLDRIDPITGERERSVIEDEAPAAPRAGWLPKIAGTFRLPALLTRGRARGPRRASAIS